MPQEANGAADGSIEATRLAPRAACARVLPVGSVGCVTESSATGKATGPSAVGAALLATSGRLRAGVAVDCGAAPCGAAGGWPASEPVAEAEASFVAAVVSAARPPSACVVAGTAVGARARVFAVVPTAPPTTDMAVGATDPIAGAAVVSSAVAAAALTVAAAVFIVAGETLAAVPSADCKADVPVWTILWITGPVAVVSGAAGGAAAAALTVAAAVSVAAEAALVAVPTVDWRPEVAVWATVWTAGLVTVVAGTAGAVVLVAADAAPVAVPAVDCTAEVAAWVTGWTAGLVTVVAGAAGGAVVLVAAGAALVTVPAVDWTAEVAVWVTGWTAGVVAVVAGAAGSAVVVPAAVVVGAVVAVAAVGSGRAARATPTETDAANASRAATTSRRTPLPQAADMSRFFLLRKEVEPALTTKNAHIAARRHMSHASFSPVTPVATPDSCRYGGWGCRQL
jgi:hypothetical protein